MKTYSTGGRLIAIILTTAFLTGEVGSGCMGAVKVYAAESEVLSAEEMTGMIPVYGDEVISEDIILSEEISSNRNNSLPYSISGTTYFP